MDLAKIRKKSLQTPQEPGGLFGKTIPSASLPASGSIQNLSETVPVFSGSSEADLFQRELSPTPANLTVCAPQLPLAVHSVRTATCTPLEAILAGRTAAGCGDESVNNDDSSSRIEAESFVEFLCFRVSDEIYGINIMDIKEIIKPRVVTEVPRAPLFVPGVLSLRGTIILIIDMRFRLGLERKEPTGKERIVVIKNNNSFCGLLVDEVIKVAQVQLDTVEASPTILDGIDRDFVSGLCRSDGKLIIILNLENIADINVC